VLKRFNMLRRAIRDHAIERIEMFLEDSATFCSLCMG
jgi:hypothetical protein